MRKGAQRCIWRQGLLLGIAVRRTIAWEGYIETLLRLVLRKRIEGHRDHLPLLEQNSAAGGDDPSVLAACSRVEFGFFERRSSGSRYTMFRSIFGQSRSSRPASRARGLDARSRPVIGRSYHESNFE
jgi:hypothetical protein